MPIRSNQFNGRSITLLGTSGVIDATIVASTPIMVCGELQNLGAGNLTCVQYVELVYSSPVITSLQVLAGSMATTVATPADDWHGSATVMTTVPVLNNASIIFPDVNGALAQKLFIDGTIFGLKVTVAGPTGLTIVANAYGFTTT